MRESVPWGLFLFVYPLLYSLGIFSLRVPQLYRSRFPRLRNSGSVFLPPPREGRELSLARLPLWPISGEL